MGLCEDFPVDENRGSVLACGLNDTKLNQCAAFFIEETKQAAKKASELIVTVKKNLNKKSKDLLKNTGKLGKFLMKNQFVYKAFLKSVPNRACIEKKLSLKGERINQVEKSL